MKFKIGDEIVKVDRVNVPFPTIFRVTSVKLGAYRLSTNKGSRNLKYNIYSADRIFDFAYKYFSPLAKTMKEEE